MFALSHDCHRAFLYHPPAGMRISVIANLATAEIIVSFPMSAELENRYAVYEDFEHLENAIADPEGRSTVARARDFSVRHSTRLAARLEGGLTIARLAELVADPSL